MGGVSRSAREEKTKMNWTTWARRDDAVDILVTEITKYLDQIRRGLLTKDEGGNSQGAAWRDDEPREHRRCLWKTDMVALAKSYYEGELCGTQRGDRRNVSRPVGLREGVVSSWQ